MQPAALSHPATTRRILRLLAPLDWTSARVADVGAGRGHFSHALGEWLAAEKGLDPTEHVFPCDLMPETFEYGRLHCRPTEQDGRRLPFDDDSLDVVVSIEVIEHIEDSFAFFRELARITKPGGKIVVTTPNVLNLDSRVCTLIQGFPRLFNPLPLVDQDMRFLSGHIHPITPYYLAYSAHRAGLVHPRLHGDRTKASAVWWVIVLGPILLLGRHFQIRRLARKYPSVLAQNKDVLAQQSGLTMWTSRTTILEVTKAGEGIRPAGSARVLAQRGVV